MNRLIDWFARNGVAANLLALFVVVAGLVTLWTIKIEVFPEFSMGYISITVPYPGAAPEEVEEGITVKIEEQIQGLPGIKRIQSTAAEGVGTVLVQLETWADERKVLDDVKARVDSINSFPEDAEKPVIQQVTNRWQVISVAISGDVDEKTLKEVAEKARDELAALPEISIVELQNVPPYEISIEVPEENLRRWHLSFDEVAAAVRNGAVDIPGGSIRGRAGEVLLRGRTRAYRGPEFERLVVRSNPDGTRLLVGDVARVRDGFAETDQRSRFDGRPAVLLQVYRVGEQRAFDVANAVKRWVAQARPRMPAGIVLETWQDNTKVLRDRLDTLLRNALQGFILVFITLALFLELRLSFWVSLGIPVSFLGAIWLMPAFDVSVNLVSLFAFIVVLGMVVDDAIIIGENVHTHQQRTGRGVEAAIRGTREVATPVIFAVLTTVAAFLPLVHVAGVTGKVMRVVPLIVIPVLFFSLLESLLVLPNHLSHVPPATRRTGRVTSAWRRFRGRFDRGLQWFIHRVYAPSLERALAWRYLVLAAGIASLLLTAGLVLGGFIRFVFFPTVEADFVSASVRMPLGTPVEVTEEAARQVERAALELRQRIDREAGRGNDPRHSIFRHVLTSIGDQPLRTLRKVHSGAVREDNSGSHLAEIAIELAPAEERTVSCAEIVRRWRRLTGPVPGAVEVRFASSLFDPGDAINVELAAESLDDLRRAADELKDALHRIEGVYDIADSHEAGKRELRVRVTPAGRALGLTQLEVARQVRQAFYGEEVQRIQRGTDELKVKVRYPAADRKKVHTLEEMRFRLRDGTEIPFPVAAVALPGRGFAKIERTDRRRTLNVTADVDLTRTTPTAVAARLEEEILPRIMRRHPGMSWRFEGEQREQRETMRGLLRGFLLALVGIYALIAIPFRSWVQPLIVMSAIPFGLIGAVVGHLLLGLDLTILSMFGVVALAGVVVNDSLVMVEFVNRARERGEPLFRAIREAGVARFRPILLTTATTFAGLAPLMLERSMQAQFLIPMAVSLAFGIVFATAITLVLVPCLYVVLEDLRRLAGRPEAGGSTTTP